MSVETEDRIDTKELLRQSGISLADLHHWVARGLLPTYCGRYFDGGGGSRCYYPAWAVDRARDIKRLRDLGISGQKIRKILRGEKVKL